jgi:hypothetical protein
MEMNIYSQCSDFKLTNQKCFSNGASWSEDLAQELDTGNVMSADLIPFLSTFEGVLTYQLQGRDTKPDNQPGATHIRFLVAWKSEGYKKFLLFVHLIEYDDEVNWNRIKLEKHYQRYISQVSTYTDPIKDA